MMDEGISDKLAYPSKFVEVHGSKMHYIEAGQGDPILLLHGVPTSCYLWRNIIPHLSPLGRCIAPDLIGFGKSDKPDIEYSAFDHIKYIEKFIEVLGLKKIILVMHGWGSVIGLDYAMHHEKNCKGLVLYEAFLHSLNGEDASLPFQEQLIALQEQEDAHELITDSTDFIDKIMTQTAMRNLTKEELENYRRPFSQKGSGKAIYQYIKELPHAKSKDNNKIEELIESYTKKLVHSNLPKLILYSVPGFVTSMATVMWAKEHLKNLEIADIGEELHLAQESNPQVLGETISVWLQGVEAMR